MYGRILVPLDGSELAEQVLPYVRCLAEGLQAAAILVRVVEPLPSIGLMNLYREVHRRRLVEGVRNQAEEYLNRIAKSLRDEGVKVSYLVRHGDPASEVISEAESEPATIIAMATHGRSGVGRWALGSIADKVLHATTTPLLMVRPKVQRTLGRVGKLETITVPIDGTAMAEQSLPHVTCIAKALGLKVILLRVTPATGEYHRYTPHMRKGETRQVYVRQLLNHSGNVDETALGYLHKVKAQVQQQGVASVDERLVQGHPAAAIIDLALETPNNLMVMTTHARSGLPRWVLGSVTARVVRNSGNPVLVIRPMEEHAPA